MSLHVELHAGDLLVRTGDRRDTVVDVVGPDADDVRSSSTATTWW